MGYIKSNSYLGSLAEDENFLGSQTIDCSQKGNCNEHSHPKKRMHRDGGCCMDEGININFNVDSNNDNSRTPAPVINPVVMNPYVVQPVFKTDNFTSDVTMEFPTGAKYTIDQNGNPIIPEIQTPGATEIPETPGRRTEPVTPVNTPVKRKKRRIFHPEWL